MRLNLTLWKVDMFGEHVGAKKLILILAGADYTTFGWTTQASSVISSNVAWTYKVQYNAACGCLQFYWGSAHVSADTAWNPYQAGNWIYPFQIEVPGEVVFREDAMPWLNATRMTATAIQGQSFSDTFGSVPCGTFTPLNQGLHAHISSLYASCTAFDLWND